MIHAFKTVISQPTTAVFASRLPYSIGCKTPAVRFATAEASNQPENPDNMDKTQKPNEKTGDVMSHSFGEGYSTRSDEEGFGGIYGENQSLEKDKAIHENHPAYDKSQGSEVKEKEKARHQAQADN